MLVITKRKLQTKIGSVIVPRGKIVPFDTETNSIVINWQTFQIHVAVVLGKDVKEIDWVKVKAKKIKYFPNL